MRQKYKKKLDELDIKKTIQSKEYQIRSLVDLAEQMRKDGEYTESAMIEIIKKFNERITTV